MTSISLRKSLRSVPSAAPVEQGRSNTCTSVIVWQKFLFGFYDPNMTQIHCDWSFVVQYLMMRLYKDIMLSILELRHLLFSFLTATGIDSCGSDSLL